MNRFEIGRCDYLYSVVYLSSCNRPIVRARNLFVSLTLCWIGSTSDSLLCSSLKLRC